MHTYTALFEHRSDAEAAQAQLQLLGIVPVDTTVAGKSTHGFNEAPESDNRGFWESLKNVFVSHEDRPLYEESVREGNWMLTVNVDDQFADKIHSLLENSNAVDVHERLEKHRKTQTVPLADAPARPAAPLVPVGRRSLDRDGVRVRAYVVTPPKLDEE